MSATSHGSLSSVEASVRQLIANGKSSVAVESAKELYKNQPTPASEALLVDAYFARIQSLADQNMAAEAKALTDLVCERYSSARERLNANKGAVSIQASRLENLLKPMSDPNLNAETCAAIEAAVARELDLGALAECGALTADHPLRVAAAALQRALHAVTAERVGNGILDLPEVSHRSPLASWKLLVRAIAAFYAEDDEACRRFLDGTKPGTAPARLVPALRAMLSGDRAGLTPAAAALVPERRPHLKSIGLRSVCPNVARSSGPRRRRRLCRPYACAAHACRRDRPGTARRCPSALSSKSVVLCQTPNR